QAQGTTTTGTPAPPRPTASPSSDWPTYDHDAARTGVAGDQAPIGQVRKLWQSPALDGDVYAQPLVVGGRVLAATEANSVYALDAATGAQVWRAQLGAPVDGGSLPCGDIDPTGITGTPVADPSSSTLYVVAFLPAGPHHELYALDLSNGSVRWHRPIDPPGLAARVEQLRSALTIANARVYLTFGGLFGDCGPYKGAVVSSTVDGQGDVGSYIVPTTREAGIWHPGGPAVSANGDLWVSTGNSASTGAFDYGNAVVHLSPQLQALDYFAPTDWLRLSQSDADLGSVGPALVGADRVVAAGKEGVAYLLDRAHLGNVGGSLASIQACHSGAFGTSAVLGAQVFLPCTDGLVAVSTAGDKLATSWRRAGRAGSPIVAAGLVWELDGNGTLVALDPANGQQRFSTTVASPASRFVSLAAGGGRLFVAPTDTVTAFALR
ncbi:MAG: PQQ-binding-like beta-propeller repeat protein, partial [Acidimicrobiia bacterium]|nr:PQQ-binding-like beta-propeller repeat protein [Acidimicrobiia bacterium]